MAVNLASVGIMLAFTMASTYLTPNLRLALNSVRCMINSLGNNTWTLIAAAYFAAR
jgi:hypothetical protein